MTTPGAGDDTRLAPHEVLLDAGNEPEDATDARILRLVREHLERLATTNAGWDTLFRDPRDGRLWELTFPQGTLFAGGPRRLAVLTESEARAKYGET